MIQLEKSDVIQEVADELDISYNEASFAAMIQFKFVAHVMRTKAPQSVRLRYWGVYKPIPRKLKKYGYNDTEES